MKRLSLYLCFLYMVTLSYSQTISVASGTISIGQGTTVTLIETSLNNDGDLIGNSGSMISTYSDGSTTIKGLNSPRLYSLITHGNINLETNLQLDGNLILNSGLFNLNNSDLSLGGNLIGENNTNYIFSEGSGEIIKVIDLIAGQKTELGYIGLEVTANENINGAEFRRGHTPQSDGSGYSIARYFKLPVDKDNLTVSFNFLDNELNNLNSENLSAQIFLNSNWQPVISYYDTERDNYINASLMTGAEMVTLFEYVSPDDISIPGGISPNNDSQNDIFVIYGIENYPDNRLVIFNRWGEILIEKEPYENDWGGENENGVGVANDNFLPDGTYFYIFFKDKNDKKSVRKGSFEIKSGR